MVMQQNPSENIRKILIIRMSSIGDIILTSPVVRQLRARYPDARIDFLIRREYADLMKNNPHLSELLVLDVRGGFAALKALKQRIRDTGYDAVLDLHYNIRSRFLGAFSGRPPILKIHKDLLTRWLLVKFKLNRYLKLYSRPLSVVERYLRAGSSLGLSSDDTRLELHLSPEIDRKGKRQWKALADQQYRVLIAPGAKHFSKQWPPEYYADLIQRIYRQLEWGTVLVGGPEERPLIAEIQKRSEDTPSRNMAGEISLLETIALIREAPLFISNDSGLMHVAAAFQKPQIAIFGPTVREFGFFPLNPHAVVLENNHLNCRPCTHIGREKCPQKHFRCMTEITPDQVWEVLRKWEDTISAPSKY